LCDYLYCLNLLRQLYEHTLGGFGMQEANLARQSHPSLLVYKLNPLGQSARYGNYAMEILINQLLKMGAKRGNFEAKVFGGGAVLRGFTVNNVGESNAEFVLKYLKTEKIPLAAQDLLDIYPRKVYYFPHTGLVRVKKLKMVHNDTIIKREVEYNKRLHRSKLEGDVELFD